MRRSGRLWIVWLAALVLAACASQPAAPPERPALWRATDGDTVVWVFGTIHLLPPGGTWLTGPVAQAVAASDTLITEIPPADANAQAAAFVRIARGRGLPPLAQRVAPDERAALAAAIAAAVTDAHVLDNLQTWAAALALTSGAANGLGATRQDAPEAVLERAFAGKPHAAFETFAGQLGVFAGLPEADQRRLLSAAIRGARDARADYARLLAAWRRGDVAAIAAEADRAFAGAPELRRALLTARNAAWADDLRRRAARPGTLFVAVGAGHLTGTDALPGLLSERGFRVARVQ